MTLDDLPVDVQGVISTFLRPADQQARESISHAGQAIGQEIRRPLTSLGHDILGMIHGYLSPAEVSALQQVNRSSRYQRPTLPDVAVARTAAVHADVDARFESLGAFLRRSGLREMADALLSIDPELRARIRSIVMTPDAATRQDRTDELFVAIVRGIRSDGIRSHNLGTQVAIIMASTGNGDPRRETVLAANAHSRWRCNWFSR